ncbi:MAG: CRISPR-associated protein Cas5 [Candidatus Korarchaeum sp.]
MSYPAFSVDVEFVWGFQARIVGLSKTSPSFHYPPPTTLLGALSCSIARDLRLGEKSGSDLITQLGRNILAIGVRPINCVPLVYEDLSRIIAVKMGEKLYPRPDNLAGSYDSPARGKTSMVSLNGDAPRLRFSLVLKSNSIEFEGEKVAIKEEHFWKIHRLGSKESRVSVVDVKRLEAESHQGRGISYYGFPVFKDVKPIEEIMGKWTYEVYINPRKIGARLNPQKEEWKGPFPDYMENAIPYRVPIMVSKANPPKFLVEAKDEASLYKVGDEILVGWAYDRTGNKT